MLLVLTASSLGILEQAMLDEYVFPENVGSARRLLESDEKTVKGRRHVQHNVHGQCVACAMLRRMSMRPMRRESLVCSVAEWQRRTC